MRAARLLLGLVAALLLGFLLLELPFNPVRAQSDETDSPPPESEPLATHELYCGPWRVDGSFVSTLRIKNSLIVAPLAVQPVLHMADGTPYLLPPVELAVSGVATVNVNQALAAAPPEIAEHLSPYGSVALRYQYESPGHVLGSVEILDVLNSLIFTYPFNGIEETSPEPQTLEGLWWRHDPDVTGFVSLSNATPNPLQATVQAIGSRGTVLTPEVVEIPAHGSLMVHLDSLVGGLPGLENQAGGLRVQYEGRPGELMAAGGLVNESTGYSANIRFSPRAHHADESATNTYASVGIMVGEPDPAAGFPGGTQFAPYAVLRNTTGNALTVKPELNFMAGAQPVTQTLPDVRLRPFETRHLTFERAVETLGLAGMINVAAKFDGRWDDLLLATGSTDQSGTYVFEVEPQGVGRSFSKEAHYWKAADGFDTMITLWNPTDEAQDYLVTFFYGQEEGQYKLPVRLEAKGSRTIDVSAVIAAQQPDEDGSVIPLGTPEGSAVLSSAAGMTEWMTLVASVGILNVQTATCGTECTNCCGYSNFRVTPDPGTCFVGSTAQCGAKADYCNGQVYSFTGSSSWSSSELSILTVNNTTQKGLVTGISPGSATVIAHFPSLIAYTGTICNQTGTCPQASPNAGGEVDVKPTVSIAGPANVPLRGSGSTGPNSITLTATGNPTGGTFSWSTTSTKVTLTNTTSATVTVTSSSASGSVGDVPVKVTYTKNSQSGTSTKNITVRKPTSLYLESDTTDPNGKACSVSCLDGSPGCGYSSYLRTRIYVVQDQFSQLFANLGIDTVDVRESFSGFSSTCGASPPVPGTAITSRFGDEFYFCSPACLPGGQGCTGSATQTVTVNGFSVRSVNVTWTCTGVTVSP